MSEQEAERAFLERVSEYLLSLPFDLKILQEAVTDPDLDKSVRLVAASTIVHTILPQEGEPGPLRYVDDVLFEANGKRARVRFWWENHDDKLAIVLDLEADDVQDVFSADEMDDRRSR